jgi:hypothetical protein
VIDPGMSDAHVRNVLDREFHTIALKLKRVTDATEVKVNGHKLYLSAGMDNYNGEIFAHQTKGVRCLNLLPAGSRQHFRRPAVLQI